MKAVFVTILANFLCLLVFAGPVLAAKDEYLGDASIYAGVPTTMSEPNVLIIIDNSRATLNTAPGEAYDAATLYAAVPESGDCVDNLGNPESNPQNGCFLPWYIYAIDNQGDIANQHVLANASDDLTNLTCVANDDVIRKTLLQRGTYSGSGTTDYPNIANGGGCETAPQGKVYVLGNYLNYTRTASAPPPLPATVPAACSNPNPVVKACEWKNNAWNCSKFAYFQLRDTKLGSTDTATHRPATLDYTNANSPYHSKIGTGAAAADNPETLYWTQLASAPAGVVPQWLPTNTYTTTLDSIPADDPAGTNPSGKTCAVLRADANVSPPAVTTVQTQREVMYRALEQAVGGAIGSVNFGAMVYGANNSGGTIIYPMADLSVGVDHDEDPLTGELKPVAPDCSDTAYQTLPFCQFLAALPGLRKTPVLPNNYSCSDFYGAGCVSSATGRPQAESVYDAGYYYGATYQNITNSTRIADDIKNICGLNHIILLTNGFTNGDGSPNLATVGDADGDQYPDESTYGLGSHWLDDVAKYLNVNYGVTTHTVIAFQEKDDLVENAAVVDGGGKFYQAYNAQQLAAALTKLLATIINPKSTSFVAPVVPASTTNRTISSNKVYLGLFRPQQTGPWHGNVKKYSVSDANSNQLMSGYDLDSNGQIDPATDPYGAFYRDSISYWSLVSGSVPSARGDINPLGADPNKPKGDGGEVDAGGVGGKLLKRVEALAAAVRAEGWAQNSVPWRNIYTVPWPGGGPLDLTEDWYQFTTDNPNLYPYHFVEVDWSLMDWSLPDWTQNPEWQRAVSIKDNLIRYLHGFGNNELGLSGTAVARKWVLGDVLHSRPQVVSYNRYSETHESTCTPGADGGYNGSVIYVGANDGMLHAFRDCDGEEIWAFVPPSTNWPYLSGVKYIKDPVAAHPTSMDGAPSFFKFDKNGDGIINPLEDKVILVIGQRRGGGEEYPSICLTGYGADGKCLDPPNTYTMNKSIYRGDYYALDVTEPYAPKYLWQSGWSTWLMGETWSQPMMAKVLAEDTESTRTVKQLLFVGGGYDNVEDLRFGNTQTFPAAIGGVPIKNIDINTAPAGGSVDGLSGGSDLRLTSPGNLTTDNLAQIYNAWGQPLARGRGLYALEVATFTLNKLDGSSTVTVNNWPQIYWQYTSDNNPSMDFSFASDLTVLDIDGNGFMDRIYAGDTGGSLWRFDLSDADKNNWDGEILFKSNPGGDGSNGRKIFYPPAVAIYNGAPHVYFGTGDREHPLNRAVTDRMYCVVDWKDLTDGAAIAPLVPPVYPFTENNLEDVTVNLLQETASGSAANDATLTADLQKRLYSTPFKPYDAQGNYKAGWYIKLDGTDINASADPGEKILAQAEVFSGAVYFNTYKLTTGARAGCEAGNLGESYGYAVDFKTGEAVFNFCNDQNCVGGIGNDVSVDATDAAAVQAFTQTTNERAVGSAPGEILKRKDRRRALGSGIPSGAVIVVDSAGRVKLLMSSSEKVSVFEGYSTKAVHPIYWMQW